MLILMRPLLAKKVRYWPLWIGTYSDTLCLTTYTFSLTKDACLIRIQLLAQINKGNHKLARWLPNRTLNIWEGMQNFSQISASKRNSSYMWTNSSWPVQSLPFPVDILAWALFTPKNLRWWLECLCHSSKDFISNLNLDIMNVSLIKKLSNRVKHRACLVHKASQRLNKA